MISSLIFNKCLGPLIIDLEKRLGTDAVVAYAEDIAFMSIANLVDRTLIEILPMIDQQGLKINQKYTQIVPKMPKNDPL